MNKPKYSIVLVEDDELLLENYKEILSCEGYEVFGFDNRFQAFDHINNSPPNLVILDIGLDMEKDGGITLCHHIRQKNKHLPIVFLTSHSSDDEKIKGLLCEVDDYLTKDISTAFLLVRIEILLKRVNQINHTQKPDVLERGDLTLHMDTREIYWKKQKVNINTKQYVMLLELVLYPGQAKSLSKLMSVAQIVVEPNTIAANIKQIRQQFKLIDPLFCQIKAAYGSGYIWQDS